MCVPVIVDTPQINLDAATMKGITDSVQANTATPPATAAAPRKDNPQLAADEGRVYVPGALYPGDVAETLSPKAGGMVGEKANPGPNEQTTPPAATDPIATGAAEGVTDATKQTDDFQAQIAAQQQGFQSVAAGILQSQQMAADAMRAGFLSLTDQQTKALAAADELRKNTGQASRKPNYTASLKKNAQASRGGVASTMVSGIGGVPTSALSLGRASLLGG